MSDKSIAVQNFRWGLEGRRSELITQPGALASIVDGHINAGGEIEQRLGFILFATLYTIVDSLGDRGLFGGEATDAGLVVFGSALPNGSSVTFSQPTLNAAMPSVTPVIVYQQLQHPEIYDQRVLTSDLVTSVSYDRTKHRMTAAVSCNFQGKAAVLATFADGNTFLYYNGVLDNQSRNGRVLTNQTTLSALSKDASRQVRSLPNWTAQPNNNAASPTNTDVGATGIFSPAQVHYSLAVSRVCAGTGQIGLYDSLSVDQPGTIGTTPSQSITISIGGPTTTTGKFTITAPRSNVDPTIITLLEYTPSTAKNASACALDIATLINRLSSNLYYFTQVNGAQINLYAPAAWGTFTGAANSFTFACTDANVTFSNGAVSGGTLAVQVVSGSAIKVVNRGSSVVAVTITAHPSGGTLPYKKFVWTELTSPASGIVWNTVVDGNGNQGQTNTFSKLLSINQAAQGHFLCTLTDNVAATATADFTVYLELDSNN